MGFKRPGYLSTGFAQKLLRGRAFAAAHQITATHGVAMSFEMNFLRVISTLRESGVGNQDNNHP